MVRFPPQWSLDGRASVKITENAGSGYPLDPGPGDPGKDIPRGRINPGPPRTESPLSFVVERVETAQLGHQINMGCVSEGIIPNHVL